MQTFRLLFICKLFQSRLQVSPGLLHVKTTPVFITHAQHLAETLPSNVPRGKRH